MTQDLINELRELRVIEKNCTDPLVRHMHLSNAHFHYTGIDHEPHLWLRLRVSLSTAMLSLDDVMASLDHTLASLPDCSPKSITPTIKEALTAKYKLVSHEQIDVVDIRKHNTNSEILQRYHSPCNSTQSSYTSNPSPLPLHLRSLAVQLWQTQRTLHQTAYRLRKHQGYEAQTEGRNQKMFRLFEQFLNSCKHTPSSEVLHRALRKAFLVANK